MQGKYILLNKDDKHPSREDLKHTHWLFNEFVEEEKQKAKEEADDLVLLVQDNSQFIHISERLKEVEKQHKNVHLDVVDEVLETETAKRGTSLRGL